MKSIDKILRICTVLLSAVVFLCAAHVPVVEGMCADNCGNHTSASHIYSSDDFQCAAVNIFEQTYKSSVSFGERAVNSLSMTVISHAAVKAASSAEYCTWLRLCAMRLSIFADNHKEYYIYTLRKLLI